MADNDQDDLNNDTDDGATGDDSGTEKSDESIQKPPESEKRIRDLQSDKDKETARANKAEKALRQMLGEKDSDVGKPPADDGNAALDPAILDMARMFAFQQNPKLAEFGVEMSDINGSTPSEIASAAAALVARFEKIETVARNKVLAEHGLTAEVSGGAPPSKKRDFTNMSKEDFDKLVAEATKGGRP